MYLIYTIWWVWRDAYTHENMTKIKIINISITSISFLLPFFFVLWHSVLGVHWKDWCWSWNSSTLATSSKELTHWKRPWCWEGLGAGGEGDDRGWDGWMASLTRWAWVWVNSGNWWWTGRPGVLRFMGSQRVGHDWATELNWTDEPFGLPWWLSGKESAYNAWDAGDVGLIPGWGRSPGGGHGNPLQNSWLENPTDRGAWWATVHRVTRNWTQLKRLSTHARTLYMRSILFNKFLNARTELSTIGTML